MKKIVSCITASLMFMSIIPSTVTALEVTDTLPQISVTEKQNADLYYIFYKDIDTTEIDKIAEEKRAEYIYTLYEQDLTKQKFEQLSTEYYLKVRLELLEKAYSEMSTKVLKELGINNEAVFCSKFTPTIICELTDEQIKLAEASELIESVSVYKPIETVPSDDKQSYSSKEDFINIITGGKDVKKLFGEDVKVAAELNCKKDNTVHDYFIIYGLKNKSEIDSVINKLAINNSDLKIITSPVESRSGTLFSISSDKIETKNTISGFVFVDDEYPAWISKQTIASFTQMYNFDPSMYIIRLGDTNNDFKVNASDASDTLRLYAQLSTESDFSITAEHLKHYDVNSDGIINASDASAILSYYAFLSTGGEDSIKDFLNTP